jgi:hypothetical protein
MMLDILYRESQGDPEGAVRIAGRVKGINNRLKNNLGMLEGFKNFGLVARQVEREKTFAAALEADPSMMEKYGDLLEGFRVIYDERLTHAKADLILEYMVGRGTLLSQAMLLHKWSIEKEKDDMDRDPDFMDREIPSMKMKLRIFQMGFHQESDRELLRMFLREILTLPAEQRIEGVTRALGAITEEEIDGALDSFLGKLYTGTSIDEPGERMRMFGLSNEELMAEKDAFIDLAAMLYDDNEARIEREKAFDGAMTLLRPRWIEARPSRPGKCCTRMQTGRCG